ncbi:hypothetical protein MKW92_001982, partial [Papaver armeniacum]
DRQTQVGDMIDYGVYIFTPYIYGYLLDALSNRRDRANLRRVSSFSAICKK